MEILSREYGWLPSEIREQRREDLQNYIDIISIRRTLEKKDAEKLKSKRRV